MGLFFLSPRIKRADFILPTEPNANQDLAHKLGLGEN